MYTHGYMFAIDFCMTKPHKAIRDSSIVHQLYPQLVLHEALTCEWVIAQDTTVAIHYLSTSGDFFIRLTNMLLNDNTSDVGRGVHRVHVCMSISTA
jgi:hypothetical protein